MQRSPKAYLHRSGSLLRWVIGPHIGFKSSQVIKHPHNSGGVECVHAVETKVKPAWRTSILRSAFLCATQIWRKNEDMLLWVIDHSLHVSCHQQRVSGFSRFWPVTHDYVHRRVPRRKELQWKVRENLLLCECFIAQQEIRKVFMICHKIVVMLAKITHTQEMEQSGKADLLNMGGSRSESSPADTDGR